MRKFYHSCAKSQNEGKEEIGKRLREESALDEKHNKI